MPRASAQIDLAEYARRNPRAAAALEAQGVPAQAKARAKESGGAGERAEAALYASLTALGIVHEAQYAWGRLLPVSRAFRADAAIVPACLLIEVMGGAHIAGRDRLNRDIERTRLAAHAGWTILPYSPEEAISGEAALDVLRYLEGRG